MKVVLFNFFGTLVEYQPHRPRLGAADAHRLARSYGFKSDHDTFVSVWDKASSRLEQAARTTLRKSSMTEAAGCFFILHSSYYDHDCCSSNDLLATGTR